MTLLKANTKVSLIMIGSFSRWLYLDTSTSAQLTAFLQGKLRDAEQGRDRAIEQKIDELKSLLEKQGCAMNTIRYVLDNHTRRLKAVKAQKKNS